MNLTSKTVQLLLAALLCLGLAACASGGRGSDRPAPEAEASAPSDVPPPAGSPLSKVDPGMSDSAVREILGEPDRTNSYQTGKAWIPYYHGPDTSRSDWTYDSQGRVVFSRNRYSGNLKVVRVIYNPDESGD
jgi:hypothetical protein